jgi:hypothetical protein
MKAHHLRQNRNRMYKSELKQLIPRTDLLIKKFPALYGTCRFLTVFARNISGPYSGLGYWIPYRILTLLFFKIHFILSSTYAQFFLPSCVRLKFCVHLWSLQCVLLYPLSQILHFHLITLILCEYYEIWIFSLYTFFHFHHFISLKSKHSPQHFVITVLHLCSSLITIYQVSRPHKNRDKNSHLYFNS